MLSKSELLIGFTSIGIHALNVIPGRGFPTIFSHSYFIVVLVSSSLKLPLVTSTTGEVIICWFPNYRKIKGFSKIKIATEL